MAGRFGKLARCMVAACTLAVACTHDPKKVVVHQAEGDGKLAVSSQGHCLTLNPEYRLHLVRACEDARHYIFHVAGQEYRYDKQIYRARLREALVQMLRQGEYPWQTLGEARIEVWLRAPLWQPEQAGVAVAVLGRAGNFAAFLPLAPEQWDFSGERLLLLGAGRYPSSQARQAGLVSLQARAGADQERALEFLEQAIERYSAQRPGDAPTLNYEVDASQWPIVHLHTRAFSETTLVMALRGAPRADLYVAQVGLQPVPERNEMRGLLFRFSFRPETRARESWSTP